MNTTDSESLIEVLVERFEKHQLERILRLNMALTNEQEQARVGGGG